jgi:hypothetical protein
VADDPGIDGSFRRILDAISDGVDVTGPDRTIARADAAMHRAERRGRDEADVAAGSAV